jgi:hypothetical protein
MADTESNKEFLPGPASSTAVSLGQALLAPLDAIFKSQIHAARSFLSLLLQMGTPHVPVNKEGNLDQEKMNTQSMYMQEFSFESTDEAGNSRISKVSIPTLSLIPVTALAIDSAEFQLEFRVTQIERHRQIQASEKDVTEKEKTNASYDEFSRPWYLVKEPISLRGMVAAPTSKDSSSENTSDSTIKINIKIGKQAMPAGLDRLLTTMNQVSKIAEVTKPTPPTV